MFVVQNQLIISNGDYSLQTKSLNNKGVRVF